MTDRMTDRTTTETYDVTGLTCDHCVRAIREEVGALPGVDGVDVALVPGGTSRVTVASAAPVDPQALAAALDEAGEYVLTASS